MTTAPTSSGYDLRVLTLGRTLQLLVTVALTIVLALSGALAVMSVTHAVNPGHPQPRVLLPSPGPLAPAHPVSPPSDP